MTMTREESKHPKNKTSKAPKKVFDVVRPGKSPAPPNSRSVIVGHKAQVQDDQFVPEHTSRWAGDPSQKRALMDSRKKIELNPSGPIEGPGVSEVEEVSAPPLPAVPSMSSSLAQESSDSKPAPIGSFEQTGTTPLAASTTSSNQKSHGQMEAAEHLADLAIEQVVETKSYDKSESSSKTPDETAESIAILSAQSNASELQSKTADNLLAETGAPDLPPQKAIVSTHRSRTGAGTVFLVALLIIVTVMVALNFLLDAEILRTDIGIPYTDLIQ